MAGKKDDAPSRRLDEFDGPPQYLVNGVLVNPDGEPIAPPDEGKGEEPPAAEGT